MAGQGPIHAISVCFGECQSAWPRPWQARVRSTYFFVLASVSQLDLGHDRPRPDPRNFFLGNVSQPDLGEATVADVAAGAVAAAVAVAVAVAVVAL